MTLSAVRGDINTDLDSARQTRTAAATRTTMANRKWRLKVILWAIAIALGLLQSWTNRYVMGSDGNLFVSLFSSVSLPASAEAKGLLGAVAVVAI